MNVELIIFLGGQGQQCLSERALNATQLFPTRLLFLGAALRLDDWPRVAAVPRTR
jgi:hypothetical protein